MNFYKRYMGDFVRDTAHLRMIEQGAYDRLLDHYYSTEAPLPNDNSELYRVSKAFDAAERKAVDRVLEQFFPVNGDGQRHNKRADEEIGKHQAQANINRRIAGERIVKRKEHGSTDVSSNVSSHEPLNEPINESSQNINEPSTDRSTNRSTNRSPSHSHRSSKSKAVGGESTSPTRGELGQRLLKNSGNSTPPGDVEGNREKARRVLETAGVSDEEAQRLLLEKRGRR